jgi:cytochrome c2
MRIGKLSVAALAVATLAYSASAQTGDVAEGTRLYRACMPCHSLEPEKLMPVCSARGPCLGVAHGQCDPPAR